MAFTKEMKFTEQQSNNHNPTTPPTPMTSISPSVDTAEENQTQAKNGVEILTSTTHATGTKDHHCGQTQGSPDHVEADTTAMAIPIGGINPQQRPPMKAVIVEPLQWIITTLKNYGLHDGHDEGLSDSDSGSGSGSSDAGDEEQPESDSGDDDDDDEGQSDSGDADGDGDGESGSDSGDADDEKQSGSDSGDGDDEDEEQSDSDSDDDDEEEENEEEAEEEEDDMDVDDEPNANPPGVNTDDGGNNSLSTPRSIEIDHRDSERSDPGTPDLTSGSSEDDNDGPNIRGPVTATSPGLENGDRNEVEIADGPSVLRTIRQRTDLRMQELRPARTPTSNASDGGILNSGQTQRATPMGPEKAAEGKDGAVSSNVASGENAPSSRQEYEDMKSYSEEDAPASSQEDEDMKSDFEENEVSGTLRLRGGAGEPDMETYLDEEEIELTGSGSHLLRSGSQRNEDVENSVDEQGEAQGPAVPPDQDSAETANQPGAMISHGQDDANLDALEVPETPPRGRHGGNPNSPDRDEGRTVSSPELPTSRYPLYQRSEEDSEDPVAPLEQDVDDDTSQPDWDADYTEADPFRFSDEIPETPPRSAQRLGDDPADFDLDEGEEVPSTEDRVALLTGYRRPEAGYGRLEADDEEDQADEYQGGESSIEHQQSKGKSTDFSQQSKGKWRAFSPNEPSSSDDPIRNPDRKDDKTIHLRFQYLVARSKRAKASMCLWIPADIAYPDFTQTILNALQQHDGIPNPYPAHPDAVIARLLLFIAGSRPIKLTSENLQEKLAVVDQRSVYDYVKVEFVPETNGEVRRRKGSGKINGRCGKVGGL